MPYKAPKRRLLEDMTIASFVVALAGFVLAPWFVRLAKIYLRYWEWVMR